MAILTSKGVKAPHQLKNEFITNVSDYVFCPELTYIIETKQRSVDPHS